MEHWCRSTFLGAEHELQWTAIHGTIFVIIIIQKEQTNAESICNWWRQSSTELELELMEPLLRKQYLYPFCLLWHPDLVDLVKWIWLSAQESWLPLSQLLLLYVDNISIWSSVISLKLKKHLQFEIVYVGWLWKAYLHPDANVLGPERTWK